MLILAIEFGYFYRALIFQARRKLFMVGQGGGGCLKGWWLSKNVSHLVWPTTMKGKISKLR